MMAGTIITFRFDGPGMTFGFVQLTILIDDQQLLSMLSFEE